MDRLDTNLKQSSLVNQEDYNAIPVHYCKHCLSLSIRIMDEMDYCDKCGGTEIETTNILDWERMYKDKYGERFLNKK